LYFNSFTFILPHLSQEEMNRVYMRIHLVR
jgi:hypothetical protein